MRYSLNELLAEEDIAALTAETFEPESRPRPKHIRRFAALAACAVLIVGALNFGAIAAGAQKMWQYVIGIGAVEVGSSIFIQKEPVVWEEADYTCTLDGAYEQNGILSFRISLHRPEETEGNVWFAFSVLEDGVPCQTLWGDNMERVSTAFQPGAWREEYDAQWGYRAPEQYTSGGSFAGYGPIFQTGGSGHYTVQIWSGPGEEPFADIAALTLTAELDLQVPDAQGFREHSIPQDGGTLTALVSEEGRRVSFYLDGADNGLSLRCPYGIWFVDTQGNRYRGVLISGPANLSQQSVEVRLEAEPSAPIVSIEVGALLLSKDAPDGSFLGYEDRPELDWTLLGEGQKSARRESPAGRFFVS